jgi:hypothetical protein
MTIIERMKQEHFDYISKLEKKLNPIKFTNTVFDEKLWGYVSKSTSYDIEAITDQNEEGEIENWTR